MNQPVKFLKKFKIAYFVVFIYIKLKLIKFLVDFIYHEDYNYIAI